MYDIGKTDPETLYDFAISLSCTTWTCLDTNSELYKATKEVFDSAWGQLPETIFLDFRPDIPTPKPPVTLIWDETTERYI